MAVILKQAKELGMETQFISVSSFYDPKILELAGNAAEGVIFSAPYYDLNKTDPLITAFATSFEAEYGHLPNIWAGYGYDVARVAAEGLKSGKEANTIRDALYGMRDFAGVTGSVSFDKNGDVVKELEVFTVRNGKFEKHVE